MADIIPTLYIVMFISLKDLLSCKHSVWSHSRRNTDKIIQSVFHVSLSPNWWRAFAFCSGCHSRITHCIYLSSLVSFNLDYFACVFSFFLSLCLYLSLFCFAFLFCCLPRPQHFGSIQELIFYTIPQPGFAILVPQVKHFSKNSCVSDVKFLTA